MDGGVDGRATGLYGLRGLFPTQMFLYSSSLINTRSPLVTNTALHLLSFAC